MNESFYILFPIVVIYIVAYFTNRFCQSFQDGESSSYQPPNYVFQIVWPILLYLYGLSWNQNRNNDRYKFLLFILSFWMIVYLCLGFKILSFVILASAVYQCYQLILDTKDNRLYFLFGWLIFATFLNYKIIDK